MSRAACNLIVAARLNRIFLQKLFWASFLNRSRLKSVWGGLLSGRLLGCEYFLGDHCMRSQSDNGEDRRVSQRREGRERRKYRDLDIEDRRRFSDRRHYNLILELNPPK